MSRGGMDSDSGIESRSTSIIELLDQVPYVFTSFMVESLLFGVHLILFCICVSVLGTRRNPAHLVILSFIVIMFVTSVADIALTYRFVIHDVPAVLNSRMNPDAAVSRFVPKAYLYVSNNLFADALLIHRCYKVWGGQKYIMFMAVVALLADSVWGFLSMNTGRLISPTSIFVPVFFWSVFAFNIVITLATAGRIWWVARTARPILNKQLIQRYNTVIAIIIESGVIYPLVVLVLLITASKPYAGILLFVTIRVVCIMPTWMIVKVELGRRAEVQQRHYSLRVASNRFSTVPPLSSPDISVIPPSIHRDRDTSILDIKIEASDVERGRHLHGILDLKDPRNEL